MVVEKKCYVCGLSLDDYPYNPESLVANPEMICSCCGTHYGLDDEGGGWVEVPDEILDLNGRFGDDSHKKIISILRNDWVIKGMKWWSTDQLFHPKPPNWNPIEQLRNIPEEFLDDETREIIKNGKI